MDKLADFYQGESKFWNVTFADDITNSTLYFRMAKKLDQPNADIEILGSLWPPVDGKILGCSFDLTPAISAGLVPGQYHAEHEIRSATRVDYFLRQEIIVKIAMPKGA